jgi:hypothetical protein
MSDEQEQDSPPLMPIEQQTIMFYGKPLVVVRLPDGRPCIVLRNLMREEIRPEILRYQREVVDVLYAWAQSPNIS